MEIELKYAVSKGLTVEDLIEDPDLKPYILQDSRKNLILNARYYDTKEYRLQKVKAAFRLRKENQDLVATLKWSGSSEGGLHRRNELNYNLGQIDFPSQVSLNMFSDSPVIKELSEDILSEEFHEIIRTDISREIFHVKFGESVLEFAFDEGVVLTPMGSSPIYELEIEIIAGNEEDLLKVGDMLQKKYSLKPEKESKFFKGLVLLGRINIQEEEI